MLLVEGGIVDLLEIDVLASPGGGGEERGGGEVVDQEQHTAGLLEDPGRGGRPEEGGAGAGGAKPTLEVLVAFRVRERGQGGTDGKALGERGMDGLDEPYAQGRLADQEQDEGRRAVEVEIPEQAQLVEAVIREPVRLVEDEDLRAFGARELVEDGLRGRLHNAVSVAQEREPIPRAAVFVTDRPPCGRSIYSHPLIQGYVVDLHP